MRSLTVLLLVAVAFCLALAQTPAIVPTVINGATVLPNILVLGTNAQGQPYAANTSAAPTITNTTGTVAISASGANTGASQIAGELTSSTSGTVLFTMTFGTAAPHRWVCQFRDETTTADVVGATQSTAPTATALTVTGTTVTGDVVSYLCVNH